MKKILLGILIIISSLRGVAQTNIETSIHFEKVLNWEQLKAKAKAENKFIFMDCYATWCGPCKMMDQKVYPIDSIGRLVNTNYLSVKVQMDSTGKDGPEIKTWYNDAHLLNKIYRINSLPTFLFFSPDGKLVHRGVGYQAPYFFYKLAQDALNPHRQYYVLKEQFEEGKRDYGDMAYLANTARMFNDRQTAESVTKIYTETYLLNLDEKTLFTRENLSFIAGNTHSSKDRTFAVFYKHGVLVDSILKIKGFSHSIIEPIIENEEINDRIYIDGKPFQQQSKPINWDKLKLHTAAKYDVVTADRVVLWAKIKWLENKKDWPSYCKNVVRKVEKYGPYVKIAPYAAYAPDVSLNYCAFDIFSYSDNKDELEQALKWSEKAIKNPTLSTGPYIDTYANILYKMGRTQEAIANEEKAVAMSKGDKGLAETLDKMKKRKPTWEWPLKKQQERK